MQKYIYNRLVKKIVLKSGKVNIKFIIESIY